MINYLVFKKRPVRKIMGYHYGFENIFSVYVLKLSAEMLWQEKR
jgi:hypothetical protein